MVFIYCNTVDPFFLNFRGFGLWSCVIIGLFHDSRSDRHKRREINEFPFSEQSRSWAAFGNEPMM